ncbi:unnamed protein product [Dovyalis caffra]|uniref:Uncharacterized protein n=1 Tax=Dovyalis caffra TaxID=77055 RepID=A0AAV1QX77_9ROSI|nr:unnamed protein product [Dovyalis caffra]
MTWRLDLEDLNGRLEIGFLSAGDLGNIDKFFEKLTLKFEFKKSRNMESIFNECEGILED